MRYQIRFPQFLTRPQRSPWGRFLALFLATLLFTGTSQANPISVLNPARLMTAQLIPLEGSAKDLKPSPTPPSSLESGLPPADMPPASHPNLDRDPVPAAATSDAETYHQSRYDLLAEGDKLYLAGDISGATQLYRQAKGNFASPPPLSPPIQNPGQLPPAGQVYWREALAGSEGQLYSAKVVPLQLLVETYPQFIPAHLKLAEYLEAQGNPRQALAILERAATLYPDQADITRALILAHDQRKEWLESALTARQFLVVNPNHPQAGEFSTLADERMQRFRRNLQGKIQEGLIASAITGAVGIAVTGSPFMSLSTLQTMMLVMQGESAIGEAAVKQLTRQLKLVEQPEVVSYINNLGQKLARLAGRSEFDYEFFVVNDPQLNAFALPGGKVFVNSGAILKSNSEAELAGLLGHEIAHTVLSHGFQLATQGTAALNIARLIPAGGYVAGVTVTSFSRDMERQADIVGTRILARSGYAADGLINFTYLLNQEYRGRNTVVPWFATHPATPERLRYLENLVQQQNYNRYGYEGVYAHRQVQSQLQAGSNADAPQPTPSPEPQPSTSPSPSPPTTS